MNHIYGQRDSGKTLKCFEEAKNTGAVILCENKRALQQKAKNEGYDLTFVELSELKNLKVNTPIIVDEALNLFESYLNKAFSVKVQTVSYTIGD